MSTPAFATYGLALLLALTSSGHAASDDKPSPLTKYTSKYGHDFEIADTLVFVDSFIADRERFTPLLDKQFPKSKALYTCIDEYVGKDPIHEIEFGTEHGVKEVHHRTLVIISGFKNASLEFANRSEEEAMKHWIATFTPTRKHKPIRLILLSTDQEPPEEYFTFARLSGGYYHKLTMGKDGNYE